MEIPPVLVYSFCYAMVFILSLISKTEASQRLIKDDGSISDKPGNIIGLHIIGILWLGMVPAFLLKRPVFKTITGNGFPDSSLLIIFILLLLLTAKVAMKSGKKMQQQLVNSNVSHITLPVLFITRYFIIRTAFLFAYELFLRGFILFESIHSMGITLAVILNVVLHVLLHLFNSKKEMLACIPFSLLACWLCILFNAAWPAVILHFTFSLLYESRLYKLHLSTQTIARL